MFSTIPSMRRRGGDEHMQTDKTLSYYGINADNFIEATVNVDFSAVCDRFLSYLPMKAAILDFGCGSGRDTKYFLDKGCCVDAIDGSIELCKYASEYAGIDVKCMLFQELDEKKKYDGIWACSSILHVSKMEMPDIFEKMIRALKDNGYIYTSFKYGDFEGDRSGRYFSNYTEKSFAAFLKQFTQLQLIEEWISGDVRPGRGEEKWLNIILKKQTLR